MYLRECKSVSYASKSRNWNVFLRSMPSYLIQCKHSMCVGMLMHDVKGLQGIVRTDVVTCMASTFRDVNLLVVIMLNVDSSVNYA